jgi:Ead/Ea22-like protein
MSDLRALAEKATPGPWQNLGDVETFHVTIATNPYAGMPVPRPEIWEHNAAYIAAASPDAILRLLDERDAAIRRASELEAALRSTLDYFGEAMEYIAENPSEDDRLTAYMRRYDEAAAALRSQESQPRLEPRTQAELLALRRKPPERTEP